MKKNAILAAALLATGIGTGAAYPALAAQSGQPDQVEAQAALSAKVSLTDAVQAAQAKASGKAVEAQFSHENGASGYEVTVITPDGSERNLFVDASSGMVTPASTTMEKAGEGADQNDGEHTGGADNGGQEEAE